MNVNINIDGKTLSVPQGLSLRKAAFKSGIYIPGICGHPALPLVRETGWIREVHQGDRIITCDCEGEAAGDKGNCNLCLVAVESEPELVRACETKVTEGMTVRTQGEDISRARRQALAKLLAHHPHACLTCAQREGCSLTQCSSNVPEEERCCPLLGRCELGKIVDYIGLPDGTPKYIPESLPKITSDPFFDRDYNLCIGCLRCVRICSDVREAGVLGAALHNDRIWVGTVNGAGLREANCRFCGACVEVCPTGALQDKPDSVPVHPGDNPPCMDACPAGVDIPAYLRRIAEGDYSGALEVIYDRAPFPGILGYVCFHPCEDACKRSKLDQPVAICALKRFAYEAAPYNNPGNPQKAPATGKKVAIVGSGPAGLTAAFYLARAGHLVEVFESSNAPGGALRNAIPEYRLPKLVLDDELKRLHNMGIVFHTGMNLGENIELSELVDDGFNAVLVATGTVMSKKLNIPGEGSKGVHQALALLKAVREGKPEKLSGNVLVIGGGNVAVDAAMTARRLGAKTVTMVCLEQGEEIPAHDWELEQAREEGIEIVEDWGPVEFIAGKNGAVEKAIFKRCTRVFDDNGGFSPEYDENDTMKLDADSIIIAIGQGVEKSPFKALKGLEFNLDGTIMIDENTLQTSVSKLYAAGDVTQGPGSVIGAIASGRKAANAIDRALGGNGLETTAKPDPVRDNPRLGQDDDFSIRKPLKPERLEPALRTSGFEVIEKTLTVENAESEAARCLRCHLRATIPPVILPPDKWKQLNRDTVVSIPAVECVYQLADNAKKVTKITGTQDIRSALEQEIEVQPEGTLFCWEEDQMYSKRESELIQRHLQEHGEMPDGGDDELDDLF